MVQAARRPGPPYVAFHGRNGHWGFADDYPVAKKYEGMVYVPEYRNTWLKTMADSGAGVVAVHTRGFERSAGPAFPADA